jgi:hypothetical protein
MLVYPVGNHKEHSESGSFLHQGIWGLGWNDSVAALLQLMLKNYFQDGVFHSLTSLLDREVDASTASMWPSNMAISMCAEFFPRSQGSKDKCLNRSCLTFYDLVSKNHIACFSDGFSLWSHGMGGRRGLIM